MIVHLFISPGHNYVGHHGKPPGENALIEVPEIRCLAGRGIEGDRYLDHKSDYKGQITFFAWEVYDLLCSKLQVRDRSPGVFRRNVITRGVDLNLLIERKFEIQGVEFLGTGECSPCYWMNRAFHPRAEELLQNQGGLRARILTDGALRPTAFRDRDRMNMGQYAGWDQLR